MAGIGKRRFSSRVMAARSARNQLSPRNSIAKKTKDSIKPGAILLSAPAWSLAERQQGSLVVRQLKNERARLPAIRLHFIAADWSELGLELFDASQQCL